MTYISRISLSAACCTVFLALTGCSLSPTAAPSLQTGSALRGVVHGGSQPITGAHIYLFAANTTGYGGTGIAPATANASVSLLNAASTGYSDSVGAYVLSDNNGDFSITGDYACTPNTQVYIYALGGNAGAGPNESSGLMAVLGNCPASGNFLGTIPFLVVNEVTTIAAAYAMAGFATDATHVSSSGTVAATLGIANAFANAANMASITTGTALTTTPSGNATVPQEEINTLGDILASCVNTTGYSVLNPTTCNTLFLNALSAGTSGTQATDTATVAIYIAHNPWANVSTLFYLTPSSPPFQPTLPATFNNFTGTYTGVPNDWTIALAYTPSGLNMATNTYLAIDSKSNIWVSGANQTVVQLSNSGTLNYVVAAPSGVSHSQLTTGNYNQDLAIDASDNLWVANNSYGFSEVTSAGVLVNPETTWGYEPFGDGFLRDVGGIAIDSSNNIWIESENNTSSQVVEANSSGTGLYYTAAGAGGVLNPTFAAFDPAGNLWMANEGGSYGSPNTVSVLNPSTSMFPSGTSGYSAGGLDAPIAIAFDSGGNAWIANYDGSSLTELNSAGAAVGGSPFTGGGLSEPIDVAIDGAGNIWLSNWYGDGISEFSSSGTAISPSLGYYRGVEGYGQMGAIAIDDAADVWTSSYGGYVTELIGAAAPTINPISVSIANGTQGTRP